ncbi:hypothetical protein HCU40_10900 [Pseudanabaena biceps]|nr:hypothetical protein [Pseudanabaena biceps]
MQLYKFFKLLPLLSLLSAIYFSINSSVASASTQDKQIKRKVLQEQKEQKNDFLVPDNSQFLPLQELEKLLDRQQNFILASPSKLNPSLRIPDPEPLPIEKPAIPKKIEPTMVDYAVLDSMTTNFQRDDEKTGQRSQIIEPTWKWRFKDGTIIGLQTGFNSFDLAGKKSINNLPLQFIYEKNFGSFNLNARAGIDVYDRLPTTANFELNASLPVSNGVTLFGFLEQKPYKFNVDTIENQIKIRRFGPNIYWQIDPDTSLFSLYRWGNYSDGNNDQQSFSRLERKFGQFAIAANLFTWSYDRESQPNIYFSPRDFLVYTSELSWQGDIFNFLNCKLAINAGEQRLNSSFTPANSYQAKCTVKVLPNIEMDLGYLYSNVQKTGGGLSFQNETISGQLRMKF